MAYLNDSTKTIKLRFLDWMDSDNTGNNVSDLALDYLNRAQSEIWEERLWDKLVIDLALILDGKSVTNIPSDLGAIVSVWHDSDSDTHPDFYYYEDAREDTGYKFATTHTQTGGHSWTMDFFRAPTNPPFMTYQKTLPDLLDADDDFPFFPSALILTSAKLIYLADSNLSGARYTTMERRHERKLQSYRRKHPYKNRDRRRMNLDDTGVAIQSEQYNLSGERNRFVDRQSPSYDRG